MINIPILVYTHTDMSDVWPSFFGRLNKYLPNNKIYLICNSENHSLDCITKTIVYDDNIPYTDRLFASINEISEKTVLFIHEDMILYDEPNIEMINKYSGFIEQGYLKSIKLICAGDEYFPSDIDENLVYNEYAKFSIQPTIISTSHLLDIVQDLLGNSIWDFEKKIERTNLDYMVKTGFEKRRGIYHFDSVIFPYIATAITKGKWNYTEYQLELEGVFREYDVNRYIRGIV